MDLEPIALALWYLAMGFFLGMWFEERVLQPRKVKRETGDGGGEDIPGAGARER